MPNRTKDIVCGLADINSKLYDFNMPNSRVTHTLTDPSAISSILNDPDTYATPYGGDLELLTGGYGYEMFSSIFVLFNSLFPVIC